MRYYIFLLFFFLFTAFSLTAYAQDDQDSVKTNENLEDSEDLDNESEDWDDESEDWDGDSEDWDKDSDDDWNNWEWGDDDFMDFEFHGRPLMELNYGMTDSKLKSINPDFNKTGLAELKIGYITTNNLEDYILKYRGTFFFLSNLSADLSSQSQTQSKISNDIWRFGINTINSYGYQIGQSAIIPYNANAFVWTRVDIKENLDTAVIPSSILSAAEINTLKLYDESFRFGTYTEGGLKIQIIPLITLNAGFERTIVFPRHLFWKHLGSMAIEWIGLGAADFFTREVMDSSPAAGPIINFLLKNAVTFGLYQLRREKMNWPFKSAEPLAIDTWKVGLTFTF